TEQVTWQWLPLACSSHNSPRVARFAHCGSLSLNVVTLGHNPVAVALTFWAALLRVAAVLTVLASCLVSLVLFRAVTVLASGPLCRLTAGVTRNTLAVRKGLLLALRLTRGLLAVPTVALTAVTLAVRRAPVVR